MSAFQIEAGGETEGDGEVIAPFSKGTTVGWGY